jgi:membrane protease YdiL (CAAX protease family)
MAERDQIEDDVGKQIEAFMSPSSDQFDNSPEQPRAPEALPAQSTPPGSEPELERTSYSYPVANRQEPPLGEDSRVSWSWAHLVVFIVFAFASLVAVQLGVVFYMSASRHLSQKQIQQLFESNPQFLVGTNLIWYGLLFLFLYLTLAVLRGSPFWHSLGWVPLNSQAEPRKRSAWIYFVSGGALAIFVALASSHVKDVDHVPMQELFKHRNGALLLMAMAVFVAPLVEETIFRGYLYPLFAKSLGIFPAILLTGVLFGLMHGTQLGWSWGLVGLLVLVGIIFTSARARTGTVLASFLLHLGYNSMIALTSIIATKGFQQMPLGR